MRSALLTSLLLSAPAASAQPVFTDSFDAYPLGSRVADLAVGAWLVTDQGTGTRDAVIAGEEDPGLLCSIMQATGGTRHGARHVVTASPDVPMDNLPSTRFYAVTLVDELSANAPPTTATAPDNWLAKAALELDFDTKKQDGTVANNQIDFFGGVQLVDTTTRAYRAFVGEDSSVFKTLAASSDTFTFPADGPIAIVVTVDPLDADWSRFTVSAVAADALADFDPDDPSDALSHLTYLSRGYAGVTNPKAAFVKGVSLQAMARGQNSKLPASASFLFHGVGVGASLAAASSFMVQDEDRDGVPDDTDNCPGVTNPDQNDFDGDGYGDLCDPFAYDADNDSDGDGLPAFDLGEDGFIFVADLCPCLANTEEHLDSDGDADLLLDAALLCLGDVALYGDDIGGDACDSDDDNDGILDEDDNCPFADNPTQLDGDGDGDGDACDSDDDDDGVGDELDACPGSGPAVVDAQGCAIAQLCACDTAKNHGRYVACVTKAANRFAAEGLIDETEKSAFIAAAARSTCGK